MDEQIRNITNQSPKQFLASYDQYHKNREPFHKSHSRITFLVRNDLMKDLNELCKNRYGFKTKFINYAIERTLMEMKGSSAADVAGRELTRQTVNTMLVNVLSNADLNEDDKEAIRHTVVTTLFPGDANKTSLFNRKRSGNQYVSPVEGGRGPKRYKTPETCVEKYIEHCVAEKIKAQDEK